MKLVGPLQLPVVAALPAAGTKGRVVTLLGDGHAYHDNGTSWDDLDATGASSDLSSTISSPSTVAAGKQRIIAGGYTIDDVLTIDGNLFLI